MSTSNKLTEVNKVMLLKWAELLEQNKDRQHKALYTSCDGSRFCAVGLFCHKFLEMEDFGRGLFNNRGYFMSTIIATGLVDKELHDIFELNKTKSFPEIAQHLRSLVNSV